MYVRDSSTYPRTFSTFCFLLIACKKHLSLRILSCLLSPIITCKRQLYIFSRIVSFFLSLLVVCKRQFYLSSRILSFLLSPLIACRRHAFSGFSFLPLFHVGDSSTYTFSLSNLSYFSSFFM
jgi:hypothetical protein